MLPAEGQTSGIEPQWESQHQHQEQEKEEELIRPEDCTLTLYFQPPVFSSTNTLSNCSDSKTSSLQYVRMPEVPRIFTGESRIGEIWGGRELVEKYALEGPGRFVAACEGNKALGNRLHHMLQQLL